MKYLFRLAANIMLVMKLFENAGGGDGAVSSPER